MARDGNGQIKRLSVDVISILHHKDKITQQQAERLQSSSNGSLQELEEELVANYEIDSEEIYLAVAEHAQTPVLRLSHYTLDEVLLEKFPLDMLKRHHALPISQAGDTLTLALSDPLDVSEFSRGCVPAHR